MSWGTSYTNEGYLSHIGKNEIPEKIEEYKRINDMLWREILAYAASTPPAMMKEGEDSEYPWQEFIANKIDAYRREIEENDQMINRLMDCQDALSENPDSVTEG